MSADVEHPAEDVEPGEGQLQFGAIGLSDRLAVYIESKEDQGEQNQTEEFHGTTSLLQWILRINWPFYG